jgi:glycosyltransferase involved in cell wall biosynthesis
MLDIVGQFLDDLYGTIDPDSSVIAPRVYAGLRRQFCGPRSTTPPAAVMTAHGRPLRFCMVTTFYPPYNFGGDGVFVHRLSNELARRGHHVDVIHCVDAYRLFEPAPVADYDDHPNVTVHGLRTRLRSVSPLLTHQLGIPGPKARQIRTILEQRFDVIHYHNISLVGGPRILHYGHGIKLYSLLDYWLVCPTNVLFRFNREPCTRRHCLACTLVYKRPPQWWRYMGMLERAIKRVDAFLAPSRFSKRLHENLGLTAPVVHFPHFATGLAQGGSVGLTAPEPVDTPYFLFVGRLERLKGAHTLIPVFREYRRARLLIAGSGGDEGMLRRLAQGIDNVRFLGQVGGRHLEALYRNAVAVVVPSVCYDAAPLVICEAFREGTPALVRNLGGMPEMVQDTGGGVVYNNDTELVAAMTRLAEDRTYRAALGKRALAGYYAHWTADAYVDRYFGLIRDIAARRASPRKTPS